MIREYELGLVINPDLNDEQLEAQLLRIGQAVEAQGGEVTRLDRWGRRRLSYQIDHHRDGYYAFLDIRMDSRSVREVENMLGVQEGILRKLIIWRDPRALAERRRREQEEAARAAALAARQEAERAAFAASVAERSLEGAAVAEATPGEPPVFESEAEVPQAVEPDEANESVEDAETSPEDEIVSE